MKIYVCFSGECEQRGANAAFSSRVIADQYSDDVEEYELWDRLPEKATAFEMCGVFNGTRHDGVGYEQCGQWQLKREHFDADEYFLQWWAGEKVAWYWSVNVPDSGIYLEVRGAGSEQVGKRFAEIQKEIEAGRKPSDQ